MSTDAADLVIAGPPTNGAGEDPNFYRVEVHKDLETYNISFGQSSNIPTTDAVLAMMAVPMLCPQYLTKVEAGKDKNFKVLVDVKTGAISGEYTDNIDNTIEAAGMALFAILDYMRMVWKSAAVKKQMEEAQAQAQQAGVDQALRDHNRQRRRM